MLHKTKDLPVSDRAPGLILGFEVPGGHTVEVYGTVASLPAGAWDAVASGGTLFLQRPFLSALEGGSLAGGTGEGRYALFFAEGRPVGIACFQITEFVGRPISDLLANASPLAARAARALDVVRAPYRLGVIVCGSTFMAGEHGFRFLPGTDPDATIQSLAATVERLFAEPEGSRVPGVLFKEFYPDSDPLARRLERHGYCELPSEPTLLLRLDPAWRTFDDYLAALSSKFRVKANRAYAKSAQLVERPLSLDDVVRLRPELNRLFRAVIDRADFSMSCPGIAGIESLRRELGEELVLRGYFLAGELVGFMSGLIDGDRLEAHLVGFDYGLNREHSIYPRMLYDYIRVALDRGLDSVNFGRTAGEIKTTVGAVPVQMTSYARHRRPTVNRLVPALARAIALPAFAVRRPFKQDWYQSHPRQAGDWLAPLAIP